MNCEVWRGSVRSWECDEMGHQSSRFYFTQSLEGLAEALAWLGVRNAFARDTEVHVTMVHQHSRFLREVLDGAPIYMKAWITACGESDAEILQILYHAISDDRAALFSTRVRCVDAAGRPTPWPRRVSPQAVEDIAVSRGLAIGASPLDVIAESARPGVSAAGRGLVMPDECDARGRMRTDAIVGRTGEATRLVVRQFDEHVRLAGADPVGNAAIECRVAFYRFPEVGTRFHLRSGVLKVEEKTRNMMNWLIDSDTGEVQATLESVEIAFDLNTRRAVAWPPAVRMAARRMLIGGPPL